MLRTLDFYPYPFFQLGEHPKYFEVGHRVESIQDTTLKGHFSAFSTYCYSESALHFRVKNFFYIPMAYIIYVRPLRSETAWKMMPSVRVAKFQEKKVNFVPG